MTRTIFLAVLLVCVWPLSFAAPQAAPGCDRAVAIAHVTAESGQPVVSLTADDFDAEMGGKPARVLSAEANRKPHRILVMLDASKSMRDEKSGKWSLARDIVGHAKENGPPQYEYSFYEFASGGYAGSPVAGEMLLRVRTWDDFFTGADVIGHGVGRGPLLDIIEKGVSGLANAQAGDVLFLVTDGGEESSKTKPAALERLLLSKGVRLYAISLPMRYELSGLLVNQPKYEQQAESTDFINLIQTSGGKYLRVAPKFYANEWGFRFDDQEKMALATSLQYLYVSMAHFYRIELEVKEPQERPVPLKLKVKDKSDAARKKYHVHAQRKVAACLPPEPAK